MKPLAVLITSVALALLPACGEESPRDLIDNAQASFNDRDYGRAQALAAEAGAAARAAGDENIAWRQHPHGAVAQQRCDRRQLDRLEKFLSLELLHCEFRRSFTHRRQLILLHR